MKKQEGKYMKIGVISSLSRKTGGSLRGQYFVNALKRQGNNVHYFKPHPKLKYNLDYFVFIPYNILRAAFNRYDYILALKPFPTATLPCIFNRFLKGSKFVLDIDDLDHTYRKGLLAKYIEKVQKRYPKKADVVTVLDNDTLINYLVKNWGIKRKKIIPIEQGADTKLFDPARYDRKKLRKKYGLENKKVIAFTGHLGYTAIEVADILRIFKKIQEKRKDVFLLVVGSGSRLKELKTLSKDLGIKNNVMFTSYVKTKDMPKYVLMADVCLCYYAKRKCNYYRNAMKLREYLAMGKLVVCTNIGDLKKFSKYTLQTKPNLNLFYKAVLRALDKKSNLNDEKKRRQFVLKNFSWDVIASKLSKELENRLK